MAQHFVVKATGGHKMLIGQLVLSRFAGRVSTYGRRVSTIGMLVSTIGVASGFHGRGVVPARARVRLGRSCRSNWSGGRRPGPHEPA